MLKMIQKIFGNSSPKEDRAETAESGKKNLGKDNISIIPENRCTGCGSCFNICPVNSIAMEYNEEGFKFPKVDEETCIHCGACLIACPAHTPHFEKNPNPACFAAMASDDIRVKSSSGGLFTLIANAILKKGGHVCGAVYNDDMLVEHVIVNKQAGLDKMRGSKYLQSDKKLIYKEIKALLDKDAHVLFCGCPCDVAGLNSFLNKDYEKLLTVDLMCHGGSSPLLFQKYLKETYPNGQIKSFSFRDKSVFGWTASANIYFKDGSSEHVSRVDDNFYKCFDLCLSTRKSCGTCQFATLPRQGDITLADFWGAKNYNPEFDDGKGTSILIINSPKGEACHEEIASQLKLDVEIDLEYVKTHGQPLNRPIKANPNRDRFFQIVKNNSLRKAAFYIINHKYDVGVLGVWSGLNYGSALTYFALERTLTKMGLSVLMIDKPGSPENDRERQMNHTRRFANKYFEISRSFPLKDLKMLNRQCDSFIIGSDQVWNYGISRNFGKSFYLNFAYDEKKKIAYASSFGHQVDFAPTRERAAISFLMKRFDAISVREDDGVKICKDVYHVDAVHVVDPVFLLPPDEFAKIAKQSMINLPENYLLAYILDVTEEKKALIQQAAEDLGLDMVVLLDGFKNNAEQNRKILQMDDRIISDPEVEDWLKCFYKAKYVITDSFHGASFSIIFNKQFMGVMNKRRGFSRFQSLGRNLGILDRFVIDPKVALAKKLYKDNINYEQVNGKIKNLKDFSYNWLHNALFSPKVIDSMSSYPIIDKRMEKIEEEKSETEKPETEKS